MARVALTGAGGFLGWHLRAALREEGLDTADIAVGETFDRDAAIRAIDGAPRLVHVAGVNRATDDEVAAGNLLFARQIADAVRGAASPPPVIVYANSTQAGNGTVYGDAKARAADILRESAADVGAEFTDILLPNLFGEHGRPSYNSVVATFCDAIAHGAAPTVNEDRELVLLHAQDAADLLSGRTALRAMADKTSRRTVTAIRDTLTGFSALYSAGEIPDLATPFERDLFNTYRSYTFPAQAPVSLTRHADARGSFFEVIRTHGGPGQSSFSTTVPGISRGDHFHRRKVERFTVLSGQATISLRRVFTDEVIRFDVDGLNPAAVDMPTMWSHKITNTGTGELFTSFWTNDIFDPGNPDTIAEAVDR